MSQAAVPLNFVDSKALGTMIFSACFTIRAKSPNWFFCWSTDQSISNCPFGTSGGFDISFYSL